VKRYSMLWWTGLVFILIGVVVSWLQILCKIFERVSPTVEQAISIGPDPNVVVIVGRIVSAFLVIAGFIFLFVSSARSAGSKFKSRNK